MEKRQIMETWICFKRMMLYRLKPTLFILFIFVIKVAVGVSFQEFEIVDKNTSLNRKLQDPDQEVNAVAQAKKVKIIGTVVDPKGEPLPGVAVLVKGTNLGSATDVNGTFAMKVDEKGADVLIFSFVGMKTQEVKINPEKVMKIVLQVAEKVIDEVVVTGYQAIDKKFFTGVTVRLGMDDIKLAGEPDLARSLEGRTAGVSVQNISSTFGTAPVVRVRGASSITGNQKPLWVVDGIVLEDGIEVPVDQLYSGDLLTLISSGVAGLNTDDIESIQILKDVAATAIYGARAMNGVIVITSKKGRGGKISINYAMNVAIRPIPSYNDYNILNSKDQMSVNRELYEKGWINIAKTQFNASYGPYGKMFDKIVKGEINWVNDNTEINAFLHKYEVANTNWFEELFRTGIQQQHTVSISGGGENSSFYTSVGYFRDGGWTIADQADRYTALLKGIFHVNERFSVITQSNISFRNQQLAETSDSQSDVGGVDRWTGQISRNFDNNPFLYALQTSRAIRARDENGELEFFRRNYAGYNIIDELSKNKTEVEVRDMSFMADLNYRLFPTLSVSGRFSARYYSAQRSRSVHESSNEANAYRAGMASGDSEVIRQNNPLLYERAGSSAGIKYSILPEGGIYQVLDDIMTNYYINANIGWNSRISKTHIFAFMLGSEVRYVNRKSNWHNGYGHLFNGGNVSKPSENYLEKLSMEGKSYFGNEVDYDRFAAFFLNYSYSYRDKYIFTGTARYDGSNRLGKSRTARWLPTWNISGMWILKREKFMQDLAWLNMSNLRVAYGLNASLGNASNSSLVARVRTSSHIFHPETSEQEIYIESLANKDLTWEKQYELNIGTDIACWDDRLGLNLDYYNRKGFDLIGLYRTDGVGGESLKAGNIADMDSYGYELTLKALPFQTRMFRWHLDLNYSFHKTKIRNLESNDWVGKATSIYGVPVPNGPVRGIYSSRFAGLDYQGVPTFYDRNNNKVRYLSVQTADFSDFVYSGNIEPTAQAGLQNTVSWKGVSFSALFAGQFGHKKRVMQEFNYFYNDVTALTAHLKNRWRIAGDEQITNIPAIQDADRMNRSDASDIITAYQLYGMSDYWIADASFIRLKSVGVNYTLSESWTRYWKLTKVDIGFQTTNLGLIWLADRGGLGGEDPEFVSSGGTIMPIGRQYVITLNIHF